MSGQSTTEYFIVSVPTKSVGLVYEVRSRVTKNGREYVNFVGDSMSEEGAKSLIAKLKKLGV